MQPLEVLEQSAILAVGSTTSSETAAVILHLH